MSMPTFPENGLDITQEQAFNMLMASIAMEELSLSHIMNAEGEKLQYVLGTLPGSPGLCATAQELLDINRSITNLLDSVMQNQIMLKGKLDRVLEAKARYCPPPPPPCESNCNACEKPCKPPCGGEYLFLSAIGKNFCWKAEGCFPWHCCLHSGTNIKLSDDSPCTVCLAAGHFYNISFRFQFKEYVDSDICIVLQSEKDSTAKIIQHFFCKGKTFVGSTICSALDGRSLPISFSLCKPSALTVESASLTITTI